MKICRSFFFFSSRRRHTRFDGDWSSDVCSSDLADYPKMFELTLDKLGYAAWRSEQAGRRGSPRPIGIGVSAYVEGTGLGPFEGADVRVDPATGKVFVYLGVCQQGQGHETVFAQICAEHFGVSVDDVVV